MPEKILHSFEAGRRGKPDELDSCIANLIGSYLLKTNQDARFDLRVNGSCINGRPQVRLSGEVSEFLFEDKDLHQNIANIVLNQYNWVHKTTLNLENIDINFSFKAQYHSLSSNKKAGDSGNPIAVAYKNTPNQLPWERYIAVELRDLIDRIYQNDGEVPQNLANISGVVELKGLRADGKISAECFYEGCKLASLCQIVIAVEHEPTLKLLTLRDKLVKIVLAFLSELGDSYGIDFSGFKIHINGAGAWNKGGWEVDEGTREAKPYRDGFASYGVQEDSFSGEDPSKPSGTGNFLARYIANQIVGNDLADFARVALSYTIGSENVGLNIVTNNSGKLPQQELENLIKNHFQMGISETIKKFNLKNAKLYHQFSEDSDYFHNPELPWNQLDKNFTKVLSKN